MAVNHRKLFTTSFPPPSPFTYLDPSLYLAFVHNHVRADCLLPWLTTTTHVPLMAPIYVLGAMSRSTKPQISPYHHHPPHLASLPSLHHTPQPFPPPLQHRPDQVASHIRPTLNRLLHLRKKSTTKGWLEWQTAYPFKHTTATLVLHRNILTRTIQLVLIWLPPQDHSNYRSPSIIRIQTHAASPKPRLDNRAEQLAMSLSLPLGLLHNHKLQVEVEETDKAMQLSTTLQSRLTCLRLPLLHF